MSVVEAVRRDLERLGGEASASALAAAALVLAAELDDVIAEQACEECGHVQSWTTGHNSATSKSMCARALVETLEKLRALAPAERPKVSKLDELRQRRDRAQGGATA